MTLELQRWISSIKILDLDLLILIDTATTTDAPGTVSSYEKDDLMRRAPQARMDPHSPALTESLFAAEMLGGGPEEVELIAIAGMHYETSCTLSQPVRSAVGEVIRRILCALDRAGVHYSKRGAEPDIWWNATGTSVAPLSN